MALPLAPIKLSKELKAYISKALNSELPNLESRKDALRVSSFPFCGLKKAYEHMSGVKETPATFGSVYYTSVGTVVHTALQRWIGQKGRIWGDWVCRNRRCNYRLEFSPRKKCPKCKSEMEYVEFELKAFKHLSGHLDGVYEDSKGRFWVIDYKTSSLKNIRAHRRTKDQFPYVKNQSQIMAYCALIEKKYKIKISGWALIYLSRDNPFDFEVVTDTISEATKARIIKKCKLYDRQYDTVQNLKGKADIDFLIETKPCRDREFYVRYFKGFTECPLAAVCFTNKLRPTMYQEIKFYVKG